MRFLLFLLFVLSFSSCENLRKPLKPLISVSEFSRKFKKVAHQHEISIIENKNFDLVSKLRHLRKTVKQEIYKTKYNYSVLNNDYTYTCSWDGSRCYVAIWVKEEVKKLKSHVEILEDIKQELSMLIEKIVAIQKIVKQIEEQKKKEKDIIKKFII